MGVAARLDLNGATPAVPRYATYLGGTSDDLGHGVAMTVAGLVYLTGYTRSANFPITAGAYQGTLRGARDAFAAKGRLLTRALVVSKTVEWNRITPNPAQVFQICVTGPSYPTPNCNRRANGDTHRNRRDTLLLRRRRTQRRPQQPGPL